MSDHDEMILASLNAVAKNQQQMMAQLNGILTQVQQVADEAEPLIEQLQANPMFRMLIGRKKP